MENSRLNKLPAELRINIYEFALAMPNGIELERSYNEADDCDNLELVSNDARKHLHLLSTCRQIRQEALPIFFACNAIRVDSNMLGSYSEEKTDEAKGEVFHGLKSWLPSLGAGLPYAREIVLRARPWHSFSEQDDYVISFLHFVLARNEFKDLLPNHRATLSIELSIHWSQCYTEPTNASLLMDQITIGVNRKARAVFTEAFKAPEKMIEQSLDDEAVGSGVTSQQRREDMQRSRGMIGKLLDELESAIPSSSQPIEEVDT